MCRMLGFFFIFVAGYYALKDQRGIKWCTVYTKCREVYVDSGIFREVFLSQCAHSTVFITGTLNVTVHDMDGHHCRK